MANYKGVIIKEKSKGGFLKVITFSGTVKVNGVGISRKILGYKKRFPDMPWQTVSDSSGNFTLSIPGGSNDEFRLICIGEAGENSQIFEHLTE